MNGDNQYQLVAVIREEACIGCTKCIPACPVDAILGAAKQIHTVIATECTGCQLCLPPCPVDCIEIRQVPLPSPEQRQQRARKARQRVQTLQLRLTKEDRIKDFQNQEKAVILRETRAEVLAAIQRMNEKIKQPKKEDTIRDCKG